ncbi:MAG: prephenate dehydratase [Alphaproteobacteria bacterium]|nr:MAG: prephenate dehydratase [Alphaproteobacteria bacterium]
MNTPLTTFSTFAQLTTSNPTQAWRTVAFQGVAGAYAHIAAKASCPHAQPIPCESFADAIAKVESGEVDGAVLPVENSTMGRISDIHALLPQTPLQIVGEFYLPINHCLIGLKSAEISDIKLVISQSPAIQQCLKTLKTMGLAHENYIDTAGSAKLVAEKADPSLAALASSLAAEEYGLKVLKSPMNDLVNNTTRFLILGKNGWNPPQGAPTKTTLLVRVRDIPAALYKVLGGFATNGLNLSRLESYLVGGSFNAAEFFIDVEAHPQDPTMQNALEELAFYAEEVRHYGTYPTATQPA